MMRKAINLHHEEWETLRRLSYEENRAASDIVREALRLYFKSGDRK
jgi:predicted DNA-binding protein